MNRIALETKPAAAAFIQSGLSPEAMAMWRDCVLAWPFWSIGQRHVEDVGPYKFHGVFGTGILPDSDWRGSPWGAALSWNGNTADKLTVADPPSNVLDGFSAFSVEITFRVTTIPGAGVKMGLVGKYRPATAARSWRLHLSGDELELQTSSDGAANEAQLTTNANLAAGTWYQAVVTFKSGVWAVRLNGVILTTDGNFSTETSAFAGTEEFKVGQRTTSGGGSDVPLSGEMASVRLWTRALAAEETLRLWEHKWEQYERDPFPLGFAAELMSGAAAGPWVLAGKAPRGAQSFIVGGLNNGVSYDVRGRPIDLSGNQAAGNTPIAGTPVAGVSLPVPLLVKRDPFFPLPEGLWTGMS